MGRGSPGADDAGVMKADRPHSDVDLWLWRVNGTGWHRRTLRVLVSTDSATTASTSAAAGAVTCQPTANHTRPQIQPIHENAGALASSRVVSHLKVQRPPAKPGALVNC